MKTLSMICTAFSLAVSLVACGGSTDGNSPSGKLVKPMSFSATGNGCLVPCETLCCIYGSPGNTAATVQNFSDAGGGVCVGGNTSVACDGTVMIGGEVFGTATLLERGGFSVSGGSSTISCKPPMSTSPLTCS